MSLSEVKAAIVEALRTGDYQSVPRTDRDKNHLDTGVITPDQAIAIVQAARGPGECEPHHLRREVPVWKLKSTCLGVRWYIKVFFLGDKVSICWFESFHPSERK